jgi:hypothetical protein
MYAQPDVTHIFMHKNVEVQNLDEFTSPSTRLHKTTTNHHDTMTTMTLTNKINSNTKINCLPMYPATNHCTQGLQRSVLVLVVVVLLGASIPTVSAFGIPQPFLSHLILSSSFVGLPSSLLFRDGDGLASTLVEKFGEAATVNQVAATAIPKIPAIPETGGIFDIL